MEATLTGPKEGESNCVTCQLKTSVLLSQILISLYSVCKVLVTLTVFNICFLPVFLFFFVFSNTLRVTRAAALQGQDGGSTSTALYIGKKGKDFDFGHVLPMKVEFVECSAKGEADGEADVTAVEKWLEKIA